jgi:hypothetical protein
MKFLRTNLFVCIATLIASSILLCIFFADFNLFDLGLKEILHLEDNELDEVVTAVLLIAIGCGIDLVRARRLARRRSEIDEQRVRVFKATMRSVHDLVNNFLNNMQLFRLEAEDGPLTHESLELFDDVISETAEKLKALGDSESVTEYKMASGVGILPQPRS